MFYVLIVLLIAVVIIVIAAASSTKVSEGYVAIKIDSTGKVLTDRCYSGEFVNGFSDTIITFPKQRQVYNMGNFNIVTQKKKIMLSGEVYSCDELNISIQLVLYFDFPINDPQRLRDIYIQVPHSKRENDMEIIYEYNFSQVIRPFVERVVRTTLSKCCWIECVHGICYDENRNLQLSELIREQLIAQSSPLKTCNMTDNLAVEIAKVDLPKNFIPPDRNCDFRG